MNGNGCVGVGGERGEDRLHRVREVPGEEIPLGGVEVTDIQDRGPQVPQRRAQLLLDEPGYRLLLRPQVCAACLPVDEGRRRVRHDLSKL